MKLRQQLLILSLLILSLPWAGCQYVREIERVMLEGQERELMASARAVALKLGEQPSFFAGADEKTSQSSIYFHRLASAPKVDGYLDEWNDVDMDAVQMISARLGEAESRAWVRAGLVDGDYYLAIEVEDLSPAYADPQIDLMTSGDYFEFVFGRGESLVVSAGSPGPVVGRYLNEQGELSQDHRISGYWAVSSLGHQLELRIASSLLDGQLALRYADQNLDADQTLPALLMGYELQGYEPVRPSFYAAANSQLETELSLFSSDQLRLGVSDRTGWLLASAGEIDGESASSLGERSAAISWLYSLVLRSESFPELDSWHAQGRFKTLDVMSALLGNRGTASFSSGNLHVVRAAYPVQRGGEMLGAVIAEKSAAAVISAADGAFSRLIFWVLLVTLFVSLGLLVYASILSLRVRRLSAAAEQAMLDPSSGQVADNFLVSTMSDEIGDLNRSYHELLGRLDEYTLYLKSLSSKLSHELRTPLAVIRSSLDNLDHQVLDQDSRTYADRAVSGVARLSSILNAMSSASRLEESIKGSEFERIDLANLVRSVVEGYRDAYPETKFGLELLADEKVELMLSPDLIVQMLDKLVDNAREFCIEDGQVTLSLAKSESASEPFAVLSVSNPGALLPEKMRTQLFDSLVSCRVESSDTSHLGLGLYIVRLIAEYHGATVFADNLEDGSGVEFRVHIPMSSSNA